MKYTLKGIVKSIEPWEEFQGSNGKTFSKREFVVDDSSNSKFENELPFTCWDKSKIPSDIGVGDTVEVDFYVKGRKGSSGRRIFINLNVADVRIIERCERVENPPEEPDNNVQDDEDEDLPF